MAELVETLEKQKKVSAPRTADEILPKGLFYHNMKSTVERG